MESVNISRLPATRFLKPNSRQFPYRDSLGRVNINLVRSSIHELTTDSSASESDKLTLLKWERHARCALSRRPDDENCSLREMNKEKVDETCILPWDRSARLHLAHRNGSPESITPDLLYIHEIASKSEGKSTRSESYGDQVYEVEKILEEDQIRGFLIRWNGYTSSEDTWEPESNIAPELVSKFRATTNMVRSHQGDDFLMGRSRMLWCSICTKHQSSDNFSIQQRRFSPSGRVCLIHHYSQAASPLRSPKRKRVDFDLESPMGPPQIVRKRVSRELGLRQADMVLARCRLLGLGWQS